jgi:hypothetical protein
VPSGFLDPSPLVTGSAVAGRVASAFTSLPPGIVLMGVALVGLAAAVIGVQYVLRLVKRAGE